MSEGARSPRLAEVVEDSTGFGQLQLRTGKDLLLRPRTVLAAYLAVGPTGGGLYARPFGFYLALCGILVFYLFLMGGFDEILSRLPPEVLRGHLERSGKSRDSFIADADGWLTFIATPILSLAYAMAIAPVLKWWGAHSWRLTFRGAFALLCAWTMPLVLFGPLPFLGPFQLIGPLLIPLLMMAAFLRMGRGIWWHGWPGGIGKAAVVTMLVSLVGQFGMGPLINFSLFAASISR